MHVGGSEIIVGGAACANRQRIVSKTYLMQIFFAQQFVFPGSRITGLKPCLQTEVEHEQMRSQKHRDNHSSRPSPTSDNKMSCV